MDRLVDKFSVYCNALTATQVDRLMLITQILVSWYAVQVLLMLELFPVNLICACIGLEVVGFMRFLQSHVVSGGVLMQREVETYLNDNTFLLGLVFKLFDSVLTAGTAA